MIKEYLKILMTEFMLVFEKIILYKEHKNILLVKEFEEKNIEIF